ncbi:hypothetical protein [Corallococcus exercitus]|uniref:Uncharacterized protein n=1 Tax=Corallococcus exercitus TaxID=2316736 RepID=A0A7Y4NBP7_9BACT|nr:hypothetical protein [Corallococcus exercitus]NOK08019.1 hypothetical protein [Corallococcus exercitus]
MGLLLMAPVAVAEDSGGKPLPSAPPSARAQAESTELTEALCKESLPQLELKADGKALYRISRAGKVTVQDQAKELLFEFNFGQKEREGIVRIELVKPQEATSQVVCGHVTSGKTYQLPQTLWLNSTDKLVVRLYDVPRGEFELKRFKDIAAGRQTALLTEEVIGRELAQLRQQVGLKELKEEVEGLGRFPAPVDGVTVLHGSIDKARKKLELDGCSRGEAADASPAPLLHHFCSEAQVIDKSLQTLATLLESYRNALADKKRQAEQQRLLGELRGFAKTLDGGTTPKEEVRKAHCEQLAALNWLHAEAAPRLITQVELPLIPSRQVLHVSYGTGNPKSTRPPGEQTAVLLHQVPTGAQVGVEEHQREFHQQATLAQAFADAVGVMVPLAAKSTTITWLELSDIARSFKRGEDFKTLTDLFGDLTAAPQLPSLDPLRPTLLCQEGDAQLKLDTGAAPIAPVGTRSFLVAPLKAGTATEISVCDKSPCVAQADGSHLKNKVTLEPQAEEESRFPFLVELAGTASFERGLSFGAPRYEAIGGTAGPQQLYELRREYEAHRAFSLSVLFGYRLKPWLALVAGPSVLVGASGGTFSQLNFRFAFPVTRGAYLTVGPSMRLVESATEVAPIGSRIAVENSSEPKVPTVPGTEYRPRFGLSLGFSVDVSVLTDTGKTLLKSAGVTQ